MTSAGVARLGAQDGTDLMVDPQNLLDGLDIDIPVAKGPQAGAAPAPSTEAHFFGPYQLIQQVGSGGVARVMRARHIHPRYADTTFAIKILHDDLSADPKVVDLFRHEAYVLSLLKHPNIVQTFEAGSQDGELYIAMEYIDGRDLDNMMSRCRKAKQPLPTPVAMHIVGETLRALAYAHELADGDGNPLNLIHRDVNPANVFLSYDGRVKLGDFGVASVAAGHLRQQGITGKVGYFAPEQINSGGLDQRADLFALGVMMFELLTGTPLFEGDTADEILRSNKRAKIPKPSSLCPDLNPELEGILLRALERKPEDRFSSAREMLHTLGRFIPSPVGMPLAVAALMRKMFLSEHIQELQLREGLAGNMARGCGQLVAIYTTDARGQAAFNELLMSRGYRTAICASLETLAATLASPAQPMAVLLDVCSQGFSVPQCLGTLKRAPRHVPVIAVSDALTPQWIHLADAVGAVDFVFKPLNIERVLTAVRAAISGAAKVAAVSVHTVEAAVRARLLLVSKDPTLIQRLSSGFTSRGFEVEVSPTIAEALERTRHTSYHAALYDAHPASAADRLFGGQLRSCPAMGLIPIVYLSTPAGEAVLTGLDADRAAIRPRTDAVPALAEVLHRLWADSRLGRTFIRYSVQLAVELRYGGRVFSGESIDLSRGGVRVRSEGMPPIGTEVNVAIRLPISSAPIEVSGRVIRVDMPSGEDPNASIGVEFERFAGRTEADYIAYLATLDAPNPTRPTLVLRAPPPSRD